MKAPTRFNAWLSRVPCSPNTPRTRNFVIRPFLDKEDDSVPSLSFDAAADFYDATRGYPLEVTKQIVQVIDEAAHATPRTPYLEVGVGTGRIGLPLASLGRTYTGVDISEKMLSQLVTKLLASNWQEQSTGEQTWGSLADEDATRSVICQRFTHDSPSASMRLLVSDITTLPFLDNSFEAVVAVHIFHLVDGWQQALSEVVRVLRPGGRLLQCWDSYEKNSAYTAINRKWQELVTQAGGNTSRPGAHNQGVINWLQDHGYQSEERSATTWQQHSAPSTIIDSIAQRHWSSSWNIPDDIFNPSIERLRAWAQEQYGSHFTVEQPQERRFFITITTIV
jgi:ubiquinone/menaquinone biosynthesis C-methylase UbiE